MFITFEGGEGSGKSTQAKALAGFLRKKKIPLVLTREPGGTKRGEALRRILLDKSENMATYTELLLFAAARAEHVEQVIAPALRLGKWVISDRYVDSTTAYQVGGRRLPEDVVRFLNMVSSQGIMPDLTFLLDFKVEDGLRRVKETRSEITKFEEEKAAFHQRVRKQFLMIAGNEPERVRVMDAALSVKMIQEQINEIVEGKLIES